MLSLDSERNKDIMHCLKWIGESIANFLDVKDRITLAIGATYSTAECAFIENLTDFIDRIFSVEADLLQQFVVLKIADV